MKRTKNTCDIIATSKSLIGVLFYAVLPKAAVIVISRAFFSGHVIKVDTDPDKHVSRYF